jgi:hypothetical protein
MCISEVLLAILTECDLNFEDLEVTFSFGTFHAAGFHTSQYSKIRPSRMLRIFLATLYGKYHSSWIYNYFINPVYGTINYRTLIFL